MSTEFWWVSGSTSQLYINFNIACSHINNSCGYKNKNSMCNLYFYNFMTKSVDFIFYHQCLAGPYLKIRGLFSEPVVCV
jgi:hypothetical protein